MHQLPNLYDFYLYINITNVCCSHSAVIWVCHTEGRLVVFIFSLNKLRCEIIASFLMLSVIILIFGHDAEMKLAWL